MEISSPESTGRGEPGRNGKRLPSAALPIVLRFEMKLPQTQAQASAGVWPSDIGSLAFETEEFFDVLDGLYLERNPKSPGGSLNEDPGADPSTKTNPLT
jgi:hypothetical protein